MELYSSSEQAFAAYSNPSVLAGTCAGTSGINVFTNCFKIKPRFQTNINQALTFNGLRGCWIWAAELGYNLFARQHETVELLNCNPLNGVFLKAVDGLGEVTTARTIKANYRDSSIEFTDPNYNRLELAACDINEESVAAPAAISHCIYGMLGIKRNESCPCFGGIGASYEFQPSEINTAVERWTVWAKYGITF